MVTAAVDRSTKIGWGSKGMPTEMGLVPKTGSIPPHGTILGKQSHTPIPMIPCSAIIET